MKRNAAPVSVFFFFFFPVGRETKVSKKKEFLEMWAAASAPEAPKKKERGKEMRTGTAAKMRSGKEAAEKSRRAPNEARKTGQGVVNGRDRKKKVKSFSSPLLLPPPPPQRAPPRGALTPHPSPLSPLPPKKPHLAAKNPLSSPLPSKDPAAMMLAPLGGLVSLRAVKCR